MATITKLENSFKVLINDRDYMLCVKWSGMLATWNLMFCFSFNAMTLLQVRQFPEGVEAGLTRFRFTLIAKSITRARPLTRATAFMESAEWERNLEGLELIVSLARGHAEVVSYALWKTSLRKNHLSYNFTECAPPRPEKKGLAQTLSLFVLNNS